MERKEGEGDEAFYHRMRQREIDGQAARRGGAKRVRDENNTLAKAERSAGVARWTWRKC